LELLTMMQISASIATLKAALEVGYVLFFGYVL
jgi:hypothetical protein